MVAAMVRGWMLAVPWAETVDILPVERRTRAMAMVCWTQAAAMVAEDDSTLDVAIMVIIQGTLEDQRTKGMLEDGNGHHTEDICNTPITKWWC
jgi:hypothetical protein